MTVRIVTDSACDLRDDEAQQHAIEVVPLSIRFGDEELTDRVQLSVEEFYRRMAASPELPQTAAPAPGAFVEAFRRQFAAGATSVVCINLSSSLSATMQSAQSAAATMADTDVRVIDSRSITGGLGTLVLLAAADAARGDDADTIVAATHERIGRLHVFGSLDTLDNLKKGGRIGGAQALLGSMLAIKPLIDISTGEVREAGKTRTRKKALLWLRDQLIAAGPIEHLDVISGQAPDLDEFLELLRPHTDLTKVRLSTIGAVIGTHGGPRVIGVSYLVARDASRSGMTTS
jgi:DegV family protein with EDD domain